MLSYLTLNPVEAVTRLRLFQRVAPYTKVSRERLGRLRELAQAIEHD